MTARIHNKHLVQRLARPQRAPELRLLGEGDDAIIQCTRRYGENWLQRLMYPMGWESHALPIQPTPKQRLARYYTALCSRCPPDHGQRAYRGELLQVAWANTRPGSGRVVPIESFRSARMRAVVWG